MSRVRRSLKASVWEGAASSGTIGLVENYLIPFGLALKANVAQVGLLSSVPNLISALIQSQTPLITRLFGGPRKSVLLLSLVQSSALFLFPLLIFLPEDRRVQALIVLAVTYTSTGGLLLAIWGAIISKFLPVGRRAGFFGWRNMIMGTLIITGCVVGGLLLYMFRARPLIGFSVLFVLAALLKLGSYFFGRNIVEPPLRFHEQSLAPFETTRRVFDARLRKYLFFIGAMNFSCSLVGPLFSVHMLRGLGFSYFTFMVLISAAQFTTFFMMRRWGRHADVVGNIQVIRLVTAVMPVLPLLWLVSSNPVFLFCAQIFGGAIWAGYNLCTQNYIYDALPASERIHASAMFNMVNGFGIFLGATVGSQLVAILPSVMGFPFFTLILLSSGGRILVRQLVLLNVREVRRVHFVHDRDLLLSVLRVRELPGLSTQIGRTIPKTTAGI